MRILSCRYVIDIHVQAVAIEIPCLEVADTSELRWRLSIICDGQSAIGDAAIGNRRTARRAGGFIDTEVVSHTTIAPNIAARLERTFIKECPVSARARGRLLSSRLCRTTRG